MSSKALFLDRDGIINVDKGYVGKPEEFEFIEGIFAVIRHFSEAGYQPVIVTNQSGIGRGFYSESHFTELCDWMQTKFHDQGIATIPVYFCPHHPTDAHPPYCLDCECRKPKAGMLLQAMADHHLDAARSMMIGDSWRDMVAAENAGVTKKILVSQAAYPEQQLLECGVVQVSSVKDITHLKL